MQPATVGVRVTGSLTVRGRTRPLSFDANVSATAARCGWTPRSQSTGRTSA